MCSIGDDIEEKENAKYMEEKPKFIKLENTCTKCRTEPPIVLLHNRYPYCKQCFLSGTVHKFKAILGKNRVIHVDDNVLIHHKIGHPSTALLQFLREGLDLITPKKLKFKPIVIFIESYNELTFDSREKLLEGVAAEVKRFGFETYYVSLSEYLNNNQDNIGGILKNNHELDLTTINSRKSMQNLTIQQELMTISERELLYNAAKYLNCKAILVPDLGIDVASQLLTRVCLGRGAHMAFDIGTVDGRDSEVAVLRPLRNFTMKELALYNVFCKLDCVSFLHADARNPYASVDNLMERFVNDLQINYPSTVSTIVRTGDKLRMDKERNEKCLLCKVPLESICGDFGSAEATDFSHFVSTEVRNANVSTEEYTNSLLEKFSSKDINAKNSTYCFACSQIANFL